MVSTANSPETPVGGLGDPPTIFGLAVFALKKFGLAARIGGLMALTGLGLRAGGLITGLGALRAGENGWPGAEGPGTGDGNSVEPIAGDTAPAPGTCDAVSEPIDCACSWCTTSANDMNDKRRTSVGFRSPYGDAPSSSVAVVFLGSAAGTPGPAVVVGTDRAADAASSLVAGSDGEAAMAARLSLPRTPAVEGAIPDILPAPVPWATETAAG